MEPNMTILEWAESVCETADKAHLDGDNSLQAQIGRNPAFKVFFENVHKLHNIQIAQFPQYFPNQFKELTRLREDYLKDVRISESVARTDTLEARFEKLETALMSFIESQKQPAKGKGKQKPVAEDETEEEIASEEA